MFTEVLDEGGRGEGLTEAECDEAVFSEGEVEEGGYGDVGGAKLFLLFDEVRAADLEGRMTC